MLNLLGKRNIGRKGAISSIVDNSTQPNLTGVWNNARNLPKAHIDIKPEGITIVDGNNVIISATEIGLITTSEIFITVVTTETGFLLQLEKGIMMVNRDNVYYLVSSDGMIVPSQGEYMVEWITLARFYSIFSLHIKSKYGLVNIKPERYMDNLIMSVYMLYENNKLNMRLLDTYESLGITGGFEFINENQYLMKKKEEEYIIRQEKLKYLDEVRERERIEREQKKLEKAQAKGKGSRTPKVQEQNNGWRVQMLGK